MRKEDFRLHKNFYAYTNINPNERHFQGQVINCCIQLDNLRINILFAAVHYVLDLSEFSRKCLEANVMIFSTLWWCDDISFFLCIPTICTFVFYRNNLSHNTKIRSNKKILFVFLWLMLMPGFNQTKLTFKLH